MNNQRNKKQKNENRQVVVKRYYDQPTKRMIAENVLSGRLSGRLASRHYNIPQSTIRDWVKYYATEMAIMKKKAENPDLTAQIESLKKEKEALEKALSTSRLKITALETMVDLAEKEFKVDIRKKSGTKQSKP